MKVSRPPAGLRETLQCACTPRPAVFNRQRAFEIRPRRFTTAPIPQASGGRFAAAPVRFPQQRENRNFQQDDDIGAQPIFTDDLLSLQHLVAKYANLPTVKPGEQPRVSWRGLAEYRDQVGESVKASKYQKIVKLLARLNQIHPSLVPADVQEAINEYRRDIDVFKNVRRPAPVDGMGRTLGAGRRKSATARAWLVEGNGEVLVNGKTLVEAFGRVHDRESVIWALKATNRIDKYNVWGLSQGGGTTGQAEALTLAIGKALMAHEPALKPALRRAGVLTRDPKRVERKKPGKEKARKMPAWVKR
ncbi:putative 40S ribosomal protein S9, mitochondrial [Glarea lozoyensis 74030]|uniref:Small ribosomal subunit protein uS9m n=1 Tax=Glarea lozoyensis (strain ATCC 74030 / MF5533) TaxID=1104152 RepID=H0EII9_GLAL7|nr:putative 40S ribosomal protein S9, mitochondrial [Glarea lozoyensis 74030]